MKLCARRIASDERIYRKLELYQLKSVEGALDLTGSWTSGMERFSFEERQRVVAKDVWDELVSRYRAKA
jgi:hypothetical protein